MRAYLEHIVEKTGKKVHVMGLSQGASGIFAGLADPNKKLALKLSSMIEKFHAFAPVIFTVNLISLELLPNFFQKGSDMTMFKFAKWGNGILRVIIRGTLNIFKLYMYTAMPEKINMLKVKFWNNRIKFNYHTVLKGSDRTNKMNCMSVVGNFKAFCPHGQSIHAMEHISQIHSNGGQGYFKKYDYGSAAKNIKYYGSAKPPSYDLSQVTTDIALYYGSGDRYITEDNMQFLKNSLKNASVSTQVLKDWGHGTFILGEYMGEFYRGIAEKHILPHTLA